MEVIRLLHINNYDKQRNRWASPAFKNSSGRSPGISVIDRECIINTGDTICSHISKYYSTTPPVPTIFWCFETDILPRGCSIEQVNSTSGDKCHYNIRELRDPDARRFFQQFWNKIESFNICTSDGDYRPLSVEDLEKLLP